MKQWLVIFWLLFSPTAFTWNALGHRLIAQIATDQMTPHQRDILNQYNQALDKVYKPQTLVDAAVWLDLLRYQDIAWYTSMHYIDLPFSDDNSLLTPPEKINALWGIEHARLILLNKYSTHFDKGIALRILLHVVGDIHQPLHAATRVSTEFPKGDQGGNLVRLDNTPIAKNLHAYWDKGAGLLVSKKRYSAIEVQQMANTIEQRWPCSNVEKSINPREWAEESRRLAIRQVYKLPMDQQYQMRAQALTAHRLALAGCRLSQLLGSIVKEENT